jgi:acyl-CoA reductase-like NAD-dependent aldehyde dehydrogenase
MSDPLALACTLVDPLPIGERRSVLARWADRIQMHAEAVAKLITGGTGKPIRLARNEVGRAVNVLRQTVDATALLEPRRVELGEQGRAEIHAVPLGPVLAVTPFNFPLNLALHKVAPAIAAGCPVLWKPSPQAPGVAEFALHLLHQAGADDGMVQVVNLDDDATAAIVADPRLGMLTFTGSAAVGRALQARVTRAKVILELGGNNAVILHDPVDIQAAARAVALGACANAGQVCISVQRIFVPEDREDVVAALDAAFRDLPTGDPWDDRTLCGPLVSDAARVRVQGVIDRYVAQGGRLRTGGTWDGRTLAPTLIDGLPAHAPGVCDAEVFAPIATIHRYRALTDALHQVELSPYGLQAGIYARRDEDIRLAFHLLQVGTLVVDDVPTRRDDRLPFGGMKDSGMGREGTLTGILDFTQPKVLWHPHG